jgi:hypothetical protein
MPATLETTAATHTEQILMDAITTLREHPEKYKAVRQALKSANTDQERVHELLNFATSERELASLMPSRAAGAEVQAAITTITVTTVFIIADSAY